jgi:hypothetical protein
VSGEGKVDRLTSLNGLVWRPKMDDLMAIHGSQAKQITPCLWE